MVFGPRDSEAFVKPFVIIGEAMGANEVRTKTPFVGASGIELLKMMNQASLISLSAEDHNFLNMFWQTSNPQHVEMVWQMHPEVRRTNVFNFHPPGNDILSICGPKAEALPGYPILQKGKYVRAQFQSELDRLGDQLLEWNPNLILALGNTPLWALCGLTAIAKRRGTTMESTHCVSGFKVLPTYHPAAVLRQWELRPTVIADLMKAAREKEYPEIRRPEREIWIEPTLEDLEIFYDRYIASCEQLSVDIETAGDRITCIGFAPSRKCALVIPFYDTRRKNRSYWPNLQSEAVAWAFGKRVLEDGRIKKLFQNGLYDIAFILRSVGIKVYGATEDTMLLSHAQQPESLKGLGFLGSLYSQESAWKMERKATTTIKRDA
jgi:uracil-DNA glycosylase